MSNRDGWPEHLDLAPLRHNALIADPMGPDVDYAEEFTGRDRATGRVRWTASRVDRVFGSNSELHALSEVHACDDSGRTLVDDVVAAWVNMMELDRFDLHR